MNKCEKPIFLSKILLQLICVVAIIIVWPLTPWLFCIAAFLFAQAFIDASRMNFYYSIEHSYLRLNDLIVPADDVLFYTRKMNFNLFKGSIFRMNFLLHLKNGDIVSFYGVLRGCEHDVNRVMKKLKIPRK